MNTVDDVLDVVVLGWIRYWVTSKVALGCSDWGLAGPRASANPHNAVIRLAMIFGAVNVTISPIGKEHPNCLGRS